MTAYWSKLGDAAPPQVWAPLEALALRAAGDPALPPLVPDDFIYAARVERAGMPDLHVLRHVLTGGYLQVDDLGELWRFVGRRSGAEGYMPAESVADALERAGLGRAERLALRTRRGPRRPGALPAVPVAEGAEDGDGQPGGSSDRTASMVSASAAALSSR